MVRRCVFGFVIAVCAMLAAVSLFHASDFDPRLALVPVFDPPAEIWLQAAIGAELLDAGADPLLNARLDDVRIRTALEDTARLRGRLG